MHSFRYCSTLYTGTMMLISGRFCSVMFLFLFSHSCFFRHMLLLLYIVFPPLKSAKNPRRQHKGICGDFQSGKPADSFSSE